MNSASSRIPPTPQPLVDDRKSEKPEGGGEGVICCARVNIHTGGHWRLKCRLESLRLRDVPP